MPDRDPETRLEDAHQVCHARIQVITESVQLPNGNRLELDMVHHPGASAVVPFTTPDEVVLIRQFRHATGGTIYEVPAGKLEPGEAPNECAIRELEEETGYRAGRLEALPAIWTTPGFTDERIHLYAAFELTNAASAHQPDEIIELVPMSLRDALELVWSGELSDAKSGLALLHAARHVGAL